MLPNKSSIKEAKKFLGYLLEKSLIPPTIQAKQRRKNKVPNKRLQNFLPNRNIVDLRTTSKSNIKQSKQIITQKRINLIIALQGAKRFLVAI